MDVNRKATRRPDICGIVGYIGQRVAIPILLEGLRRLEYRGYDSAGLAVTDQGKIQVAKATAQVERLRGLVRKPSSATVGIAHTRWATHGEATEVNAHPHLDAPGRIAIVHNGIIENAERLRSQLTADGIRLVSATGSELFAHLIAAEAVSSESLEDAVRAALRHVGGTYGLVVLDAVHPDQLVVARNGSPIVLRVGDDEMFVASDTAALVRYTQRVVYLNDGELATVRASEYHTSIGDAHYTDRAPVTVELADDDYQLGAFKDFMAKEMHEQPALLPHGFANRDLRALLAPLLGHPPGTITAGQMSYDLRRLRGHGLITRIPRTHRYHVTDTGLHHAMLLTHIHTRLLQPGLAAITDPDPPLPTPLRTAARNYQNALTQLTQQTEIAA